MIATQIEFLHEGVTDADTGTLRGWLSTHGWQTRRQLVEGLDWSERKVRLVAELIGSDIVRGQHGFKLTSQITREEVGSALQAAQAAISQGQRMVRYGNKLKLRLHKLVG